jgi:hypothetical protein
MGGGGSHRHTDLLSLVLFFQNKKSRLKIGRNLMNTLLIILKNIVKSWRNSYDITYIHPYTPSVILLAWVWCNTWSGRPWSLPFVTCQTARRDQLHVIYYTCRDSWRLACSGRLLRITFVFPVSHSIMKLSLWLNGAGFCSGVDSYQLSNEIRYSNRTQRFNTVLIIIHLAITNQFNLADTFKTHFIKIYFDSISFICASEIVCSSEVS